MRFAIAWILFGMPLAAVVFSWIGLCAHWNTEHHRFTRVSGILLPTAAALLACGALAYVQLVRPIASRDTSVPTLVFFIGVRCIGVDVCAVLSSGLDILNAAWCLAPTVEKIAVTLIGRF
jgi:uncharacterized membrane protein YidH (DUF202 family)